MTETSICPECSQPLPADGPVGACPACLLRLAMVPVPLDKESSSSATVPGSPARRNVEGLRDFPATELMADDSGSRGDFESLKSIGDYELLEEVARGGMGVVFKARQVSLNRIVAVKMILSGVLAGDDSVRRFQREAESAASLDHSSIIPVYETGEEGGRHFFSMQLVDGDNFASWIRSRFPKSSTTGLEATDLREAIQILAKTARGIHFAHQHRVLHRDLKPSNILIDQDGQPHITDFGLAVVIRDDMTASASHAIVGTPNYMAPEQVTGDRDKVTTATDVHGLGTILYEILTGRPPYDADNVMQSLLSVIDHSLDTPSTILKGVDRELETVCLKCLEKEPEDRYGSSLALAEELERWLDHKPIEARPATQFERIRKWARRRPLVALLSGVLAVVSIAGVSGIYYQWRLAVDAMEQARIREIAAITAMAPVLSPRLTVEHEGPVVSSVFLDSGRRFLTASQDSTATVWDTTTGKPLFSLVGHSGVLSKAVASNDGTRLLTVSFDATTHYSYVDPLGETVNTSTSPDYGDQTVRIWDATDGRLLAICSGHSSQVTDAAFSSDGRRVATSSYDRTARIWDATSGEQLLVLEGHTAAILSVEFSPDGERVVTSSEGTIYELEFDRSSESSMSRSMSSSSEHEEFIARVWNARTGEFVAGLGNEGRYLGNLFTSRCRAHYSPDGQYLVTAASRPENTSLWDATTGRHLTLLSGHTHVVNDAAFDAESRRVVTGCSDNVARMYSVPDGELLASFRGHTGPVLKVEFSADGERVLTASGDRDVRVWEAATGIGLAVLHGHDDRVYDAQFSPDRLQVVSASLDGTARVWYSATFEQLALSLKGHRGAVTGIEFSSDSSRAVTWSRDGTAREWDVVSGQMLHELSGHPDEDQEVRDHTLREVRSAQFSLDRKVIVTGGEEEHLTIHRRFLAILPGSSEQLPYSPVRVFDAESGNIIHRLSPQECGSNRVVVSEDGRWVASAPDGSYRSYERTYAGTRSSGENIESPALRIWDLETGQLRAELLGHKRLVFDCVFSKDGKRIVTVDSSSVRLWDIDSAEVIATAEEGISSNSRFSLSPDGETLICYGFGTKLYVRSMSDLSLKHTLEGHADVVVDASFDREGHLLVSGSADRTARIWDVTTGAELAVLEGHRDSLKFAAMSPDRKMIATGSDDRTVRIWSTESGELLRTFEGHSEAVTGGAFSPDGRWLGTTSDDYTARLWPIYALSFEEATQE